MRSWLSQRPVWVRLLAMLFVCLIVSDLAWDVSCDQLSVPAGGGGAVTTAPPDHDGDACAPLCVADCYCCSRGLSATVVMVMPAIGSATLAVALAPDAAPDGVRPIPYHPPLRLV